MHRSIAAAFAMLGIVCMVADAQTTPPTRRFEIGLDVGYQVNRGNEASRSANAPVSLRYGAVSSQYRFTIDQRATFGDRRVYGAQAPFTLDTQLGWRLGSGAKVHTSILGPYVFGSFNLTGPDPYFEKENRSRAGFGFGGGIGTRLALFQIIVRPELVLAHDLGSGTRGDESWVPARNRLGVRLGYGYQFGGGER